MIIPNKIIFSSYLVALILSISCSLFVLFHLIRDPNLHRALHNHVIGLILLLGFISEITNYPWMLHYYQQERQWKRSLRFCEIWSFFDWGFYIVHTMLFAWATIERHILIFHDKWIFTRLKRLLIHYLPPLIILIYGLTFYFVIVFLPPCHNVVQNTIMLCVISCLNKSKFYGIWEAILHQTLPVSIILVSSSTLLLRVLYQKRRIHHRVRWRKHRKMTIQLISIAILYILFYVPATIAYAFTKFESTYETGIYIGPYATYFSYFMIPLFPFVCILSLPELQTNRWQIFFFRRLIRRVYPNTTLCITAVVHKDSIIA
ncbi:unnamed protein product [Adineta ricciae]|uniref:G-protein coupled receptors family 1 profile domain-containing protein n=1 Tax=Adineta ricciae TaxID=249248 RepID=A0A814JXB5_ADIRI|nr:unnamed protein product [Adineta ricciae]